MSDVAIRGIDIHTYFVKDADRAIGFWRDTMGLKPSWLLPGQGAEFELADGSTFGLWRLEEDEGGWRAGTGVLFSVPNVANAIKHYRSKGVKINEHVEETPVCFMAFAEDSEGNHFVLHQRKTQQ